MSKNTKSYSINLITVIIFVIIISLIIGISTTMSRYKSEAEATFNTEIAFYVLKDTYQEGNIFVKDLYPCEKTFDYEFSVTNTDGTNVAETSIDYTVEMEITTNLPLEFKIYRNNSELTNAKDITNSIVVDETGETYIRKIIIKGSFDYAVETTDEYTVSVEFPIEYAEYEEYEGMVDNINIRLNSQQKLN